MDSVDEAEFAQARREKAAEPFAARVEEAVGWTADCLDSECALGSLAADALAEWAAPAPALAGASNPPLLAALLPSRFLGGGLSAGVLSYRELLSVAPSTGMIAEATIPAGRLAARLDGDQRDARTRCPPPRSTPSWQVSNLRLVQSCGAGGSQLLVRDARNGTYVAPGPLVAVRVITLSPALPLLVGDGWESKSDSLAVTVHPHSLQSVLSGYIRAHSPLNVTLLRQQQQQQGSTARGRQTEMMPRLAVLESDGATGCAPSACAPRARAIKAWHAVGVPPLHAAALHEASGVLAPPLVVIAVVAAAFFGARWWRRARALARDGEGAAARLGAGGGAASGGAIGLPSAYGTLDSLPPLVPPLGGAGGAGAGAAHGVAGAGGVGGARRGGGDPEREPLTTGSVRLVTAGQLGP